MVTSGQLVEHMMTQVVTSDIETQFAKDSTT